MNSIVIQTEVFAHHSKCLFMATTSRGLFCERFFFKYRPKSGIYSWYSLFEGHYIRFNKKINISDDRCYI